MSIASTLAAEAAAPSPGRVCPLRYRYGAAAIAKAPERQAGTLYVIGGLYGNTVALERIQALADSEARHTGQAVRLCFNGDFNWFNTADESFQRINEFVLSHDAIQGNVEAELDTAGDEAGCGCAYPDSVDAGVVERSNRIHARLKTTAARHAELRSALTRLPMLARYRVGGLAIGVVHGDADSLAGWQFDVQSLDDAAQAEPLAAAFEAAQVSLFASSHTCLPAIRAVDLGSQHQHQRRGWVFNNGAAGMPNLSGDLRGLITRISTRPSPHEAFGERMIESALGGRVYAALLPVAIDAGRWQSEFLAQWPAGSDAHQSYFERICQGPPYALAHALGPVAPHGRP